MDNRAEFIKAFESTHGIKFDDAPMSLRVAFHNDYHDNIQKKILEQQKINGLKIKEMFSKYDKKYPWQAEQGYAIVIKSIGMID